MRDLTTKQALAECARRWSEPPGVERRKCRVIHEPGKRWDGRCSGFLHDCHPPDCAGGRTMCKVGYLALGGLMFSVQASALSFREAFAVVDLRRARDRATYCRRQKLHRETHICGRCHYQGPPGEECHATIEPGSERLVAKRNIEEATP